MLLRGAQSSIFLDLWLSATTDCSCCGALGSLLQVRASVLAIWCISKCLALAWMHMLPVWQPCCAGILQDIGDGALCSTLCTHGVLQNMGLGLVGGWKGACSRQLIVAACCWPVFVL